MASQLVTHRSGVGRWVDDRLLDGLDTEVCLTLDRDIDRRTLRTLVQEQELALTAAGLHAGGSLALRMPPSLTYIATLLAGWRIGAEVALLDHRLTEHEVARVLTALRPQLVAEPAERVSAMLAGFSHITPRFVHHHDTPRPTRHALIQFSSGSTGPSKMIGRTADNLIAELDRYARIPGFTTRGQRCVVLASPLHVLGLIGGLLHNLEAGIPTTIPRSLTADGVLQAISRSEAPTTVLGVPSQARLLAAAPAPAAPQLQLMITGGEPVSPELRAEFTDRYGANLGAMYGMTEVGVIATDVTGNEGALTPAPGIDIAIEDDEILVALRKSPYVGLVDPTRWNDGWLHTRDAGRIDPATGRLSVLGRRDSQVSIGGLKVDLTEVEQVVADIPGIDAAVVLFDGAIKAWVSTSTDLTGEQIMTALRTKLAGYKRPRTVRILATMPRTATGKPVRDLAVLRNAHAKSSTRQATS
ncbi:class I adenylate-forming enzyme family protein [Nocardia sp. NPDC101769]|uniref:class I adenylate-forming enzyme family protein n=1 Tax=Nocardia sp. NPDC101769 TaxID=3364333 RepID=UPI003817499A